jgi:hypothetical protein
VIGTIVLSATAVRFVPKFRRYLSHLCGCNIIGEDNHTPLWAQARFMGHQGLQRKNKEPGRAA